MHSIAYCDTCSVVCICLCVCVLIIRIYCAKTAEPIEMVFGALTIVRSRNHVSDGGQDRTNSFAATRGNKSAMRPFAKLLWTLLSNGTVK